MRALQMLPVVGIGFASGIRSAMPTAVVAWTAAGDGPSLTGTPFQFLTGKKTRIILGCMALGEVVLDKTPIVPSRISPGPLAGRAVFGSVAGAALGVSAEIPAPLAAVLGGLSAIAGAYAGYTVRARLTESGVPNISAGLMGDAEACGLSLASVRAVARLADPRNESRPL